VKISSVEKAKAQKQPAQAVILEIIGTLQFISASLLTFVMTGLLHAQLGVLGTVIGLFVGVGLGLSASILCFALARIVTDLNAVRWNSDGYAVQDSAQLVQSLDRLNANLERLAGSPAPETEAPEAVESVQEPDPVPAPAPVPEPSEAAAGFQLSGVMKKLLYVLAALLVVAVILLGVSIVGKLT
jgi:hypothetical protein